MKTFIRSFVSGRPALWTGPVFIAAVLAAASGQDGQVPPAPDEPVGRRPDGSIVTPTDQVLTPAGRQVELPGMRPQAVALSPDGTLLATAGKTPELVLIDPDSGKVLQRVPLPSDSVTEAPADPVSPNILEPDSSGQLSYTGLVFSSDGSRVFLSNVNGSIKVFGVRDGRAAPLYSIPLPPANAPERAAAIPSGLAVSPDGAKLYVALNLANQLAEIDVAGGVILRRWDVGFAPYDVVLAAGKAYVTNWGGRRAGEGDLTGPGGRGTRVRVDPVRHIASEGSVSVIDLADEGQVAEILTGRHASGIAATPDGRHVVVANAGSDTLTVIETANDSVVETIWTKSTPAELFGASPNALAFDSEGRILFACNGTQNAVAVIEFAPGSSELEGLVPVGWFPGAIVHDARRSMIHVANIKGIGSGRPRGGGDGAPEHNSHQYQGSISQVPVPDEEEIARMTRRAVRNYRAPALAASMLPARADQPARPVPERTGEPSVFRHVVYIIKENRTYDQVLGDIPEGNGDPDLCIFGERVTPNQHKIAREFVLLDNTYCSGILSADGHQWSDSAFATDYMEKSFAGFPRSYPDGMLDEDVDALAYAPSGFIWDLVVAHGMSVRSYGEFAITEKRWRDPERRGPLDFAAHWADHLAGNPDIVISSRPAIESLRGRICEATVGWDMDIPDVFRAARFIEELQRFEASGGFPHLSIVCLPNDHTSGTRPGSPTPAAQVADNDLAMGLIVEAISRSRFWRETCIFAIEDDPQAGWDHVSGYRTTAYVVSPYTKRGAVVSTRYNQTSILRTIELMLGLPPMNQMDASATPMSDCFVDTADLTPFEAVPNAVPLDEMNPDPKDVSDALLRENAVASAALPLDEIDRCPEDLMNRILWHAMRGSGAAYPEWAVTGDGDDDD